MDNIRFGLTNVFLFSLLFCFILIIAFSDFYLDNNLIYALIGFAIVSIIIYSIVTNACEVIFVNKFLKKPSKKVSESNNSSYKKSSDELDEMIEELNTLTESIDYKYYNKEENFEEIKTLVHKCTNVSKEIEELITNNNSGAHSKI